jgi:hypothetical protein
MRDVAIKLIFLLFIVVLNNNYRLKETINHSFHLKTIQKSLIEINNIIIK